MNSNSLRRTVELVVHDSPGEPVNDLDRVHVWFCNLDDRHLELAGHRLLSANECSRAERLKSTLERRRFVARCSFVRQVLGNLTCLSPANLEFDENACGKPRLASPACANYGHLGLRFNLSHAENVLSLAVVVDREVGIDIEVVRPDLDFLAIAATHFTPEDLELLRASSSGDTITFYRLWTRKEALAKMEGSGIISQHIAELATISKWMLHSFEFTFGKKEIIGALALGEPADLKRVV